MTNRTVFVVHYGCLLQPVPVAVSHPRQHRLAGIVWSHAIVPWKTSSLCQTLLMCVSARVRACVCLCVSPNFHLPDCQSVSQPVCQPACKLGSHPPSQAGTGRGNLSPARSCSPAALTCERRSPAEGRRRCRCTPPSRLCQPGTRMGKLHQDR
jgi:hypothetical protein